MPAGANPQRRSFLVGAAALLALLASLTAAHPAAAEDRAPTVAERLKQPRPVVIAHRGCWRAPAENSLQGIRNCMALGVDFVEIDLRASKDGVIVLLHDQTLDRTTSAAGSLRDLSYGDLKGPRLRAEQGGAGAELTDQRVPTFEEVLDLTEGRVFLFLDIKEPIHEEVFRLVQKHHAEGRVLFSINRGFGPGLMTASFVGKAAVMPKFDQYENGACKPEADPAAEVVAYRPLNAPLYEAVFCDDRFLERVRRDVSGAGVWVNVLGPQFAAGRTEDQALIDPDKIWGDLLRRGVTAIQTDHPAELIAYLKRTERR